MTPLPCFLRLCLGLLPLSAWAAPRTGDSPPLRDHVEVGGRIFFTGGPVRHPPAVWQDQVFVGSDDGYLYCLDNAARLVWKFRGGPSERKVLGAGRVISAWNVSGGPVAHEGKVYFAADQFGVHSFDLDTANVSAGE